MLNSTSSNNPHGIRNLCFGHHDFRYEVVERTAHGVLPDRPDLAEEAKSESVLTLLQVPKHRPIHNPDAYAAQVTRNKARDQLRRCQREVQLAYGSTEDETDASREAHSKIAAADAEAYRRRIRREFIFQLLENFADQLDELDISILDMTADGLSKTAIARELGITRRTVYNRIKQIKERFKDIEPPDPDDDPGPGRDPPLARGSPTVWEDHGGLPALNLKPKSQQKDCKCLNIRKKRERSSQWQYRCSSPSWKGEARLSLTAKEKRKLTKRFKELFLQLPAFREPATANNGPRSLSEILYLLGAGAPEPGVLRPSE